MQRFFINLQNIERKQKKFKVIRLFLLGAVIFNGVKLNAQVPANESEQWFCGEALPEGSKSLDAVLPTLYGIVSGKADSHKNWGLMRQFFAPNAIVTPLFHDKNGKVKAKAGSVDDFIELNKVYFKGKSFYESEVKRTVFTFGHMANILSTYESRKEPDGLPYAKGINSFQLINDGRRWCVLSVTWDSDSIFHPATTEKLNHAVGKF